MNPDDLQKTQPALTYIFGQMNQPQNQIRDYHQKHINLPAKSIALHQPNQNAKNREIIEIFSQNYPTEYPEPVSTTELLKQGKIAEEVPVEMNEREGGVSSIRAWKNAYYMINVILSMVVVSIRRYKK